MPKPTLTFGANQLIPETAVAAWGARAIDHTYSIDLPADRVSIAATDDAAKARLMAILPEVDPVAEYRQLLQRSPYSVPTDGPVTLAHDTGDGFTAACVRQGGYVYFAAWVI